MKSFGLLLATHPVLGISVLFMLTSVLRWIFKPEDRQRCVWLFFAALLAMPIWAIKAIPARYFSIPASQKKLRHPRDDRALFLRIVTREKRIPGIRR